MEVKLHSFLTSALDRREMVNLITEERSKRQYYTAPWEKRLSEC